MVISGKIPEEWKHGYTYKCTFKIEFMGWRLEHWKALGCHKCKKLKCKWADKHSPPVSMK